MRKISCFIVEDNKEDRALLASFIEKTSFLSLQGTATNYDQAVKFLLDNHVDILFLDIRLSRSNGMNGIDLLKTAKVLPKVVVVSHHSVYAVDSYEIGKTSDFLLKPYTYERFMVAINRSLSENSNPVSGLSFNQKERNLFFKMGRKFQKFNLEEIEYFEAFGIYAKVYLNSIKKPMVINESMSSLINHLDTKTFIRIHKSYIINIDMIDSFDSKYLFMQGGFPAPIGGSYKAGLDNLLKVFTYVGGMEDIV